MNCHTDPVTLIRIGRLHWTGHASRMDDSEMLKTTLRLLRDFTVPGELEDLELDGEMAWKQIPDHSISANGELQQLI